MKKSMAIILSLMTAVVVQAGIIMDADNLNGDFEDGWGTGARAFDAATGVANWWNAGTGNQSATAANTTLSAPPASGYNGVLADSGRGGAVLHSVNTGYTIQAGDIFTIDFDWRDAFGWEANDQVRVSLVAYSGDTLAGSVVWEEFVNDKVTTAATWESVTGNISDLTGAVGRTLFIQTYGLNGGAGTGDFARIDNIAVSVIPEPATMGMLGLGAFFTLLVRRVKFS